MEKTVPAVDLEDGQAGGHRWWTLCIAFLQASSSPLGNGFMSPLWVVRLHIGQQYSSGHLLPQSDLSLGRWTWGFIKPLVLLNMLVEFSPFSSWREVAWVSSEPPVCSDPSLLLAQDLLSRVFLCFLPPSPPFLLSSLPPSHLPDTITKRSSNHPCLSPNKRKPHQFPGLCQNWELALPASLEEFLSHISL